MEVVTEKDLQQSSPFGFFSVFKEPLSQRLTSSDGGRRLLVRKDILVSRLVSAVEEHFKIPHHLIRLFALHYFADVQQERFELMVTTRPVASYIPQHSVPGASSITSNGTSSLVVLLTARKSAQTSVMLWWKYLTPDLQIASGGLLTVDTEKSFDECFETVTAKTKLTGPFLVYEEFGPRLVERKRMQVPIKDENLTDGDVVIFCQATEEELAAAAFETAEISSETLKQLASPDTGALQWVESLLPLFLKRKQTATAAC